MKFLIFCWLALMFSSSTCRAISSVPCLRWSPLSNSAANDPCESSRFIFGDGDKNKLSPWPFVPRARAGDTFSDLKSLWSVANLTNLSSNSLSFYYCCCWLSSVYVTRALSVPCLTWCLFFGKAFSSINIETGYEPKLRLANCSRVAIASVVKKFLLFSWITFSSSLLTASFFCSFKDSSCSRLSSICCCYVNFR